MLNLSEGKENLHKLISTLSSHNSMNEAQTRFHIIDEVIINCLGWEGEIEVEKYENNGFTDYELGKPRIAILEAKKEGVAFKIPVGHFNKNVISLKSLIEFCSEAKYAIEQVQKYASQRGVPIAIVSNGQQFIAFLASRMDGKNVYEGDALYYESLNQMLTNFNEAWQLLSNRGIKENNLYRFLSSSVKGMPKKLSSYLKSYPQARYPSETQASLRSLSEIFIQDIPESQEVEEDFIKECYCESGELEQYSFLSKNILNNRYSALFSDDEKQPVLLSVRNKKGSTLTQATIAESFSRRPIVLLGDVGVGKTSFIKNLIFNIANTEFKNSITIYINLGSEASLSQNLKKYILDEIEEQLYEKYSVNLNELNMIKGIYASELKKFDSGVKGILKTIQPEQYNVELIQYLTELTSEKDRHLKKAIEFYCNSSKKQFIVIIDNADQRTYEVQQDAFIISQELSKSWKSLVFIAVRPNTFFKSKRSGALSAYPHKAFTIQPPRIDKILEKRLNYVNKIAKGKIAIKAYSSLKAENLTLFLEALLFSLSTNGDLYEFLANITGGNIRDSIDLIVKFIGNPNVDSEKIIDIMKRNKSYVIPLHEFTKAALLGDYSHYHLDHSIATNLYDVYFPDSKKHFLKPLLLSFINSDSKLRDNNYFFSTDDIFNEIQGFGFSKEQIEKSLRFLTNRKLIETSQRVTFEEDDKGILSGDLPSQFRITSIGVYHLKKWMGSFTYLDAMCFDTPIFNEEILTSMFEKRESFAIKDRLIRAEKFKEYLNGIWNSHNLNTSYFDFHSILKNENKSFQNVEEAVKKIDLLDNKYLES